MNAVGDNLAAETRQLNAEAALLVDLLALHNNVVRVETRRRTAKMRTLMRTVVKGIWKLGLTSVGNNSDLVKVDLSALTSTVTSNLALDIAVAVAGLLGGKLANKVVLVIGLDQECGGLLS
jgi:hypothetical protein